jgi:hypothetical protein
MLQGWATNISSELRPTQLLYCPLRIFQYCSLQASQGSVPVPETLLHGTLSNAEFSLTDQVMEDVQSRKIITLIQEEHLWADGRKLTPILHLITREGERSTSWSSHIIAMGIIGWMMSWSQSTLEGYDLALFGSQTPFIQHFECHSLESVIMGN